MNTFLKAALALAAVGVIAAAGVWYFVIRSDSPPPVSLESALDAISSPTSTSGTAPTATTGSTGAAASNDGDLTGQWTIVGGGSSFVGYRVQEELVGVGSTTAVGRTTAITGTLNFDGEQITAVAVTADLTKLASDKPQRDGQLRTQGIQWGTFPNATFALTSPIEISEVPETGETVTQTVKGNLTLHGVTKAIELEVQGVIKDGNLVVVGSTNIKFADYNIQKPVAQSVLSIADNGTMELQLIFKQA